MVQDQTFAVEIEIGMESQADRGRGGGGRDIVHLQPAPADREAGLDADLARKALIAVGTEVGKHQLCSAARPLAQSLHLPQGAIETNQAAVQAVVPVVAREGVGRPVEPERRLSDAVGVAPDRCAQITAIRQHRLDAGEAENHIGEASIRGGRFKRLQGGAERQEGGGKSGVARKSDRLDQSAVRQGSKIPTADGGHDEGASPCASQ